MFLDNPEIKRRSGDDWQTLELELGEVPDFEDCFARVSQFYRDLPWYIIRCPEEQRVPLDSHPQVSKSTLNTGAGG